MGALGCPVIGHLHVAIQQHQRECSDRSPVPCHSELYDFRFDNGSLGMDQHLAPASRGHPHRDLLWREKFGEAKA